MTSTTCNYCGTVITEGSCKNCEATTSTPADFSTDTTNSKSIDNFFEFVSDYAPCNGGILYTLFIWPLVVMFVSMFYFVKILVQPDNWTDDRWRIYTLLFLFAPLGLWGAYISKTLLHSEKIGIFVFTICLVIVYSVFGR